MVGGKNGILLGTKSPYKKYFEIYCKIAVFQVVSLNGVVIFKMPTIYAVCSHYFSSKI
jgi:hypothetical protein